MIGVIAVDHCVEDLACSEQFNEFKRSFKAGHGNKRINALFVARRSVRLEFERL